MRTFSSGSAGPRVENPDELSLKASGVSTCSGRIPTLTKRVRIRRGRVVASNQRNGHETRRLAMTWRRITACTRCVNLAGNSRAAVFSRDDWCGERLPGVGVPICWRRRRRPESQG